MAGIWVEADCINVIDGCCFFLRNVSGRLCQLVLFYAFLPFVVYAGRWRCTRSALFRLHGKWSKHNCMRGQAGRVGNAEKKAPFPLMYMVIEDCLPEGIESLNRDEAAAKRLVFLGLNGV